MISLVMWAVIVGLWVAMGEYQSAALIALAYLDGHSSGMKLARDLDAAPRPGEAPRGRG